MHLHTENEGKKNISPSLVFNTDTGFLQHLVEVLADSYWNCYFNVLRAIV